MPNTNSNDTRTWFFDVLPNHPPPYPDECLSGYVLRLADLNGYASLGQFALARFPITSDMKHFRGFQWEYLPEFTSDMAVLKQLVQRTISELEALTVMPLIKKFRPFGFEPHAGVSAGQLVHGVIDSHLRVCPLCLQEAAYLRLIWRFVSVTVCLKHKLWLESICSVCGHPFANVASNQHHMRCHVCHADLRLQPFRHAPDEILLAQYREQEGLHFLLRPNLELVDRYLLTDSKACDRSHWQNIAHKFRYLQAQTGLSARYWATQMKFRPQLIYRIHLGLRVPVEHFLTYLSLLDYSWHDFAQLKLPDDRATVPFPELHICPNPDCVNSHAPSLEGVSMCENFPDRRVARFFCHACKHKFTRAYDGTQRKQVRQTIVTSLVIRPAHELERAQKMGLCGESNHVIEEALHWAAGTATQYWISSGLLDLVQQAQTERRQLHRQQLLQAAQVEALTLLRQLTIPGQYLTAKQVCRALGRSPSLIGNQPEVGKLVRDAVNQHNAEVRRQRFDAETAKLQRILETLPQRHDLTSFAAIAREVGRSTRYLQHDQRDLSRQIAAALQASNANARNQHIYRLTHHVDEAAKRRLAQGLPLNHGAILAEAGLSLAVKRFPAVYEALVRWTSGLPNVDA